MCGIIHQKVVFMHLYVTPLASECFEIYNNVKNSAIACMQNLSRSFSYLNVKQN